MRRAENLEKPEDKRLDGSGALIAARTCIYFKMWRETFWHPKMAYWAFLRLPNSLKKKKKRKSSIHHICIGAGLLAMLFKEEAVTGAFE